MASPSLMSPRETQTDVAAREEPVGHPVLGLTKAAPAHQLIQSWTSVKRQSHNKNITLKRIPCFDFVLLIISSYNFQY